MENTRPEPPLGDKRRQEGTTDSSLLLELTVPFGRKGDDLLVEVQALNGMRLWAKHFERMTVCAIEVQVDSASSSSIVWADPTSVLEDGRVKFVALPNGYHPSDHFRFRHAVRRRFEQLVPLHRYLCFSNLGAFGAWGNIGAATARDQHRPYSLWFDWVLHEMNVHQVDQTVWKSARNWIYAAITKRQTHALIRDCALGLFHGQTVYEAYAPWCRQPALVHNVHIHPEDAISDQDLATKVSEMSVRNSLRVGYVGRVHAMKSPMQWIAAIAEAMSKLGTARVEATWLGDGPMLEDARTRVKELGLEGSIRFAGFVSDQAEVLAFLRRQDVFVFCHLAPESPRCLIEALISGTPLLGYESSYARELVGGRGGAVLCPTGDVPTLALNLVQLANERPALQKLALEAATGRSIYNDEAVFAHRSTLLKQHLPISQGPAPSRELPLVKPSLLLELGVPFGRDGAKLLVESQALNGMRLWAKHFDRVTVCATEVPAGGGASSTMVFEDPCELLADGRVTFEALPNGYHPRDHFRLRQQVRRRFEVLIPAHRYLCFSNLGAFGAWGNIAAAVACAQRRPYSLWFDWVLHEMIGHDAQPNTWSVVRNQVYRAITKHQTDKAIRACGLGLFHGQTVYDAYAPLCRRPELVHDVHVHPEDAISDADLAAKLAELPSRLTLRVGYVGRVHPMKAPMQWIDAVAEAHAALGGDRIQATWLGDGPLLESARARVLELGLERSIRFLGFVSDRAEILAFLRHQDVFAFCHVTPESPRCLIEALLSATPIVGYVSRYASELVGPRGGAILSPVGDAHALALNLAKLANDRVALEQLALSAATARAIYSDAAVFTHRSRLIKRYLP